MTICSLQYREHHLRACSRRGRSFAGSTILLAFLVGVSTGCGDDSASASSDGAAGAENGASGIDGEDNHSSPDGGATQTEGEGGSGNGGSNPGVGDGPCDRAGPDVLCDPRDGRHYAIVEIGDQTWMAENLDYDPGSGVKCPGEQDTLCDVYGRLYDWPAALDGDNPSNGVGPQGICPQGSHLPSDNEWEELALTVVEILDEGELVNTDDYANIAPAFMATSGWEEDSGSPPTNSTGFSALPGGQIDQFGKSFGVGSRAWWWSSTQAVEASSRQGYTRNVWNAFDTFWRIYTPQGAYLSVRCVLD